MPREAKGARLWLRPAREARPGKSAEAATWLILDDGKQFTTGCSPGELEKAQKKLAEYITEKYEPERRERHLAAIPIADVIKIYVDDRGTEKQANRFERLLVSASVVLAPSTRSHQSSARPMSKPAGGKVAAE
jgi:hypothetical protein